MNALHHLLGAALASTLLAPAALAADPQPVLLAQATTQAPAQAPAGGVAGRLANVERLIENSSGARQVEASGVPRALEARESARGRYRDAVAAHAAGDDAGAATMLDQATRAMFEAVRLAGAPASLGEKKQDDFAARDESVGVLLDALERIGKEKASPGGSAGALAQARALREQARSLRASGQIDQARVALDGAYDHAKRGIEELRGGETLVRSLNFANKEEEYHYEVDRNDTHRMLVDVLTEEKRAKAGVDRMVTNFVDRAMKLRAEAQAQALRGDHGTAVKTLEESTKEYIRAIRSTGIYIPG